MVKGEKKKPKQVPTESWLVLTSDSRAAHTNEMRCASSKVTRGGDAKRAHHIARLVRWCDRCTSVSRWEWPRSSRGAELQTVVTSVTPRHTVQSNGSCAITLNLHLISFQSVWRNKLEMFSSYWINEVFYLLHFFNAVLCDCWTPHLICVARYRYCISQITQSVSFDSGSNCSSHYTLQL